MAMVIVFTGLNAEAGSKKLSKQYYKKAKKLKRKNLPLAVQMAAKSVKEKNDYKSAVKFLVKYHEKLYAKENTMIASIKSSGGEFYNDKLFRLYKSLTEMYDEMATLPELNVKKYKGYKFRTRDYKNDLAKSRTAAADAHYNKGMSILGGNDVYRMKTGIQHLNLAGSFEKDYRGYKKAANTALLNKADNLLASGSRVAKADVAYIYENLLYDADGVNISDLRSKARSLKKEALIKVYVNGISGNDKHIFKVDQKYLITILSDRDIRNKDAVKKPIDNLSAISEIAKAVCYRTKINDFRFKVDKRIKGNVKEYEAYKKYKTAERKKVDRVVRNKGMDVVLYGLYKKAEKDGKLKDFPEIQKIKGKTTEYSQRFSSEIKAEFRFVDATTGKTIKTFNYISPYEFTSRIIVGSGDVDAIPEKVKFQRDGNMHAGHEVLSKKAMSELYVKLSKDLKKCMLEVFK